MVTLVEETLSFLIVNPDREETAVTEDDCDFLNSLKRVETVSLSCYLLLNLLFLLSELGDNLSLTTQ